VTCDLDKFETLVTLNDIEVVVIEIQTEVPLFGYSLLKVAHYCCEMPTLVKVLSQGEYVYIGRQAWYI